MNLKELKQMIKEEYARYSTSEQEIPGMPGGDMPGGPMGGPAEPTIAVSDDDVDVTGMGKDEDPEGTLRQIFNMLKDYFEGDDDKPSAPKPPKKDDDKGGDDKPKGGAKPKGGDDKPKGGAKDDKEDDKEDDKKDDDKEALQERFKKLANIIKG